ncbi:bifunctional alpha/beta hydrolase/OsmC family protein [Pseudomonas aeruginosa]|nr:bifunctional alpha/beta hydrolase/OsmC family protein [Pseudomonas aeruginosa]PBN00593.1 osmotically inducible protein C [Pseudomonas aeruginosa]
MSLVKSKVNFANRQGIILAGLLEAPEVPRGYALFAHCFTCGKDLSSASRISRALAAQGIAVLRFDFTGLGSSSGEFANSNFSSNVCDLVAAANFLEKHYQAPSIMVGHSLGGTAVLAAAQQLRSVKGVVTIGAPAEPSHVVKQFGADLERIRIDGESRVSLAGREFSIKRQFLEDIDNQRLESRLGELRKALLIFHSPADMVVSIEQAQKLYQAARHPKSFISLDKADHLLSSRRDAQYVANCIASWAERYLPELSSDEVVGDALPAGEVRVSMGEGDFLCRNQARGQDFLADEPITSGGSDKGPTPYELLLAALGSCTSMTMRMYARRKQIRLSRLEVRLNHSREHHADCEACIDGKHMVDSIRRELVIEGDMTVEQRLRLLQIAELCPVHKTLHNQIKITTHLKD